MKIVVDNAIPFINGVFEPYAEVIYCKGTDISHQLVKDADAIVIRTRTKCNEALLRDSSVRLIATATIGEDHIDKEFCSRYGIAVNNAAGCNAGGVVQYVFTALYGLAERKRLILPPCGRKPTMGVVGVGNVGSKIAEFAERMGFNLLLNDPYKVEEMVRRGERYDERYVGIEDLLKNSDIVTLHTSLNPTSYRLAGDDFFRVMKGGATFINASRGEVVDDDSLLRYREKLGAVVLDVWNSEPHINLDLLKVADIHTPHIAGYSLEGKINGTTMTVHNVANFFNINDLKGFSVDLSQFGQSHVINFGEIMKNSANLVAQNRLSEELLKSYDIFGDSDSLQNTPDRFEQLRNGYNYRREFTAVW